MFAALQLVVLSAALTFGLVAAAPSDIDILPRASTAAPDCRTLFAGVLSAQIKVKGKLTYKALK